MMQDNHRMEEAFVRTFIERYDVDILFECFAGLLIRAGAFAPGNIHVIPVENYSRNYQNDIIPVLLEDGSGERAFFRENNRQLLIMHTSRSAILDYLPEEFYIEPDNTDEYLNEKGVRKSGAEIEEYRRKQKEQLRSAGLFFRPLEVAYNNVRIERELQELQYLENFDEMLAAFWGEFPVSNPQWKRFVRSLHLVPAVIGDIEKTKALIEFVLGFPVVLALGVDECCEVSIDQQKKLTGDDRMLGYNMMLGDAVFDYLNICTLKLTDLSTTEFLNYFEESSDGKKLLDEIINYYFPLDVEVELDFSILSDAETEKLMILGYSSKLGL